MVGNLGWSSRFNVSPPRPSVVLVAMSLCALPHLAVGVQRVHGERLERKVHRRVVVAHGATDGADARARVGVGRVRLARL